MMFTVNGRLPHSYERQIQMAKLEALYKARLLPRPYKQPIPRIPARMEVQYRDGFEVKERLNPERL